MFGWINFCFLLLCHQSQGFVGEAPFQLGRAVVLWADPAKYNNAVYLEQGCSVKDMLDNQTQRPQSSATRDWRLCRRRRHRIRDSARPGPISARGCTCALPSVCGVLAAGASVASTGQRPRMPPARNQISIDSKPIPAADCRSACVLAGARGPRIVREPPASALFEPGRRVEWLR